MERYRLDKSNDLPGWWVITDLKHLVVVRFKEHEFNETQQVTLLDDSPFVGRADCADELATIMRELGDYVFRHCYSIAFPMPVYEIKEEGDKQFIVRNKFPKFTLEVQDDCTPKQLSDAIRKCSEYLRKRYGREEE